MIIATAGHVDHGKTSLVNALTGVDTDRLNEEKQRGLTIDLGFAYSSTENDGRLGFVDVPGHIRFINNMLAGVSAIDYAMLVVAADDGVMPQTREHLDILNLLGIQSGLIALTKIDRCDDEQIDQATQQIAVVTAGTFLEHAEIFPVSSITGDGMETLQLALEVADEEIERKQYDGLFRLAIDRRFSVKGAGIVVTGSIFSGSVAIGDELFLMPQRTRVRVRGMHTQNEAAETGSAGDRAAINITGNQLELEDIHRGNWLTSNPGAETNRADALISVLPGEPKALRHWTPVHIHTAANHVTGRVATLESGSIAAGGQGLAQLVFEPPINLCSGDRVVIRDQAAMRTIGGGVVVDPWSPKRGRAKPDRIAVLQQVDSNNAAQTLTNLINSSQTGFDTERFRQQFNLTSDELQDLLTAIVDTQVIDEDLIIHGKLLTQRETELTTHIESWHENNPGKSGLPLNQLSQLVRYWPEALARYVVNRLVDSGVLQREGNLIKRPGFGIQLSDAELQIWNQIQPLLADDITKPPVLHDLANQINSDPKSLERVLTQVAKTGLLVRPVKNRFFLPEAISELKQVLIDTADDKQQLTVQDYRDATGIGRNLAIEILEFFDRQGFTRRVGDVRQLTEKIWQ